MLEAIGISKSFGHVVALDQVNLTIDAGEVVALVGDNGAGKSTLVSVLAGLVRPDQGSIHIDGKSVRIVNPAHAQQLGIATVFQDLALIDQRDVASNMFAGHEPCRFGFFVDRRRMIQEATALISELGVNLPSVRTRVGDLSGGQRQATAIVRALVQQHRVVLMDEPAAALGVREATRVLDLTARLRDNGHGILLVSHNMESVFDLADRIVVLRHGRLLASKVASQTSKDEIVGLLTGARLDATA